MVSDGGYCRLKVLRLVSNDCKEFKEVGDFLRSDSWSDG